MVLRCYDSSAALAADPRAGGARGHPGRAQGERRVHVSRGCAVSACGFKCRWVHDRRDKKIRDLEVSGRRTVLVWSLYAGWCATTATAASWRAIPRSRAAMTGRLARRLVADAKVD